MDNKVNNQKKNTTVWPEKLYTQNEVNDLLDKKENTLSFQAEEIKAETKTANKQKRLNKRKVANLVKKSNRILISISSHAFPFELFPDTINIEESRITIINRRFLSSEVHSVDIKDISNVFINQTVFFAQLVIISKTYEENEIKIRHLRNEEAVLARRIIEGLRVFENKQIDTFNYTKKELISKLKELSTTEIVT